MDCRTHWRRSCCSHTGSQPCSGRGKNIPTEASGNDTQTRGCAFSTGGAAEGTHGGIWCFLKARSKGERVGLAGMPQHLLLTEKINTVCIYHEHPPLLLPSAIIKLSPCVLLLQGEEGVGAAERCQVPGTTAPQAPPNLGAWFA